VTQNQTADTERTRRAGERRHALEVGRTRLLIAGAAFGAAFLLVAARLVELTVLHETRDAWFATARPATVHAPGRAEIVDRNGVVLATNLKAESLFANPQNVIDAESAARKLRTVLPELDKQWLADKLDGDGGFVWLRRHLSPNQVYAINRLGVPGLEFRTEERRIYPLGAVAGHVVGFTDIDGRGIAGVEAHLDGRLKGGGAPVRLSLDARVQQMVRAELADGVARFRAIGGAAIVLDARSGEVVAMVSLPEFDPNAPQSIDEESRFNRNTLGVYEMGSTFKVFTTAMALDRGTATMADGYDATRPILVSRFVIRDSHAKARWLSLPEIFMYSSNIGAAKMALDVGVQGHHDFLGKLGMFVRSPVELPETGQPLVPGRWREINTMTIAFGHGLSVSPLHLASGVAAMVNGGILYPPTVLARGPAERSAGRRVVSEATSLEMRRLMRLVVEQGTGKKADVPGYMVGGKTGTAEKVVDGGYRRKAMLSSFVGAFPIHDPRYVILAMLDEPHGTAETRGEATGGWVAAPVVGRMIARIAPALGMAPLPSDRDDVKQAMQVNIGRRADGVKHLASY
jgi:cell division protein FtsI (penicillin-binding protein 3)